MARSPTPTLHQLIGELTSKVDMLVTGQQTLVNEVDEIKKGMEGMRAEDVRIDNRITLTMAVSKAYLAGWASAFTALGAAIGAVVTYIAEGKFP